MSDDLIAGVMAGLIIAASHWIAYRWGRHVENPCFWRAERARSKEPPEIDPRDNDARGPRGD